MKLGLLAGESSGDALGAGVMRALRVRHPNIEFIGVGGPLMQAQGLTTLYPFAEFSIHGFVEPLQRLPRLYRLLTAITAKMQAARVDGFLGIDFNVFNLLLEARLKRRGVPTAHYVSPSVYAWRRGRTKRIARSADLLLTLFPFEPAYYRDSSVRAVYVGHPMADEIAPVDDAQALAERRLAICQKEGLPAQQTLVALLPGSRGSELKQMLTLFLHTAQAVHATHPQLEFVLPCPRLELLETVNSALARFPSLPVHVLSDANTPRTSQTPGRRALGACHAALVKSGTSTLEAMLLRRPMVIAYRLPTLTYHLVRRLLRTQFVGLPNILAGREIVPECLQHEATVENLAQQLRAQLPPTSAALQAAFHGLHIELRCDASDQAAQALERLLGVQV